MKTPRLALACTRLTLLSALLSGSLAGCSSSDSYSRSTVSMGSSFYYGSPYPYYPYYGYDGPDYIVTPPPRPDYPGELPVRPEQPIARPPGGPERPTTLPAASSRSRMPSAQPRMSSPSARPSIPGGSRGGGGRRGR